MIVYLYNMIDDKRKLNKTLDIQTMLTKNFVLKDVSNVNNLNAYTTQFDFHNYNYLYIPELKRYYFIDSVDVVNNDRLYVKMSTDYLMTYKTLIDNSTLHFIKSSVPKGSKIIFDKKDNINVKTYDINNPFKNSYSDVLITIKG